MRQYLRIAGLAFATMLVAGCGIFGDDEEKLEPAELIDFDETIDVKRVWSAKLGGESPASISRPPVSSRMPMTRMRSAPRCKAGLSGVAWRIAPSPKYSLPIRVGGNT